MANADAIRVSLDKLVSDLIQRSSFFVCWKPGKVDLAVSGRFLVSFDALVKSFPGLIAAGAARMEDETSRTVLAVNLYQECGEGDPARSHWAIYRKFLSTAGIDPSTTENTFAAEWKTRLSGYIQVAGSPGSVLGALGAGEFLAQPALSRIYGVLKTHYPQADQEYFTRHLVLEEDHVREITSIMALEAEKDGGWEEVISGFKFGLSVWEAYFNHLANFVTAKDRENKIECL
jgi:hypothetical protein